VRLYAVDSYLLDLSYSGGHAFWSRSVASPELPTVNIASDSERRSVRSTIKSSDTAVSAFDVVVAAALWLI